jgi:ubiquinone biosynthesis protein UbiJ
MKHYALVALQKACHHALALDESMPSKLLKLNGRVIKIVVNPLKLVFYIQFHDGQMLFLEKFSGEVDTTIQSSPLGFIRLSLLPASKLRSLFNEQIQISGDVELGQQVKQLFDELDIDWEGHLAQFTGDAVAHQFGVFIRHGKAFAERFSQSMCDNVTEYLQEEVRLTPSPEEVTDFFNDVDELVLDVERLSARVHLLIHQPKA